MIKRISEITSLYVNQSFKQKLTLHFLRHSTCKMLSKVFNHSKMAYIYTDEQYIQETLSKISKQIWLQMSQRVSYCTSKTPYLVHFVFYYSWQKLYYCILSMWLYVVYCSVRGSTLVFGIVFTSGQLVAEFLWISRYYELSI